MQIQKVAIIQVALLYLAITTVEAAGHVTARDALHVAPIGGVDLIQHHAEAANQRIPLLGTVAFQIQAALLGEEAEAQILHHRRILHPSQGRGLLPNIHV